MDKSEQALILREQASQQLAQIKSIESGKEYLSKVKGIEAWAKAEKQDAQMMTMIAEQKLRTQRILGQLIKQGRDNGEIRVKGQLNPLCDSKSYNELGLEPKSAQRWQHIASIPEPAFNQFIEQKKAEVQEKAAELTTAGMLRFKKEIDSQNRFDTEEPWSELEIELRSELEQGKAVAVNQKTMKNLCKWASDNGLFMRVDRFTDWGNPFELGKDGDRDEVCDSYEVFFGLKKSLQNKVQDLKGKALGCWCAPERCHAHYLQQIANDHS